MYAHIFVKCSILPIKRIMYVILNMCVSHRHRFAWLGGDLNSIWNISFNCDCELRNFNIIYIWIYVISFAEWGIASCAQKIAIHIPAHNHTRSTHTRTHAQKPIKVALRFMDYHYFFTLSYSCEIPKYNVG